MTQEPLRPGSAAIVALLLLSLSVHAQNRPLPDQEAFLKEARKHLQTDGSLQSSYTYVETRREQKLDKDGNVTSESVKVFESYPGLPGEERWERLIAEDGKPVPAHELEQQDRERREKALEYARRLDRHPDQVRAEQRREWEKYQRETEAAIDDLFRVFDIRMLRRETIAGHETIAFALTPRPDAAPRTREGKMVRHFKVRAWLSEAEYKLVRLEAEALDTVSIGLGLLARIHKGALFSFQRRKVNGEVWLPAESSYSGSARVGLVKTFRRGGSAQFSDYKKYSVATTTEISAPQ